MAGPPGVVLVSHGGTKKSHNAFTRKLFDRALITELRTFGILELTFRALQFKALRVEIKKRESSCGQQQTWGLLADEQVIYQEFDGTNLRGLSTANLGREVSGLRGKQ